MKPSREDFLAYAEASAKSFVSRKLSTLPPEIREECIQEALLRAVTVYDDKLEANEPWKGYCWRHATGAVLDYLRNGESFEENQWSLQDSATAINQRVTDSNEDGTENIDVSQLAGRYGVAEESDPCAPAINWPLMERLAREDKSVKILGKYLLGFRLEEISHEFELTGERIGQMLGDIIERIRKPSKKDLLYPHFVQLLYALGITHLDMKIEDQGVGWSFEPVDLFKEYEETQDPQMGFNLGEPQKPPKRNKDVECVYEPEPDEEMTPEQLWRIGWVHASMGLRRITNTKAVNGKQ